MHWQGSVVVACPRADAFRQIVDDFAQTQPLICSLTLSVETDDNQVIAAGTTGHIRVRSSSFTSTTVAFRVESYSINERLVISAQRGTRRGTDEYLFSDSGSGTMVQVNSVFDLQTPHFFQRLMTRSISRHCERDMRRLKSLLDGTVRAHAAAKSPWRSLVVAVVLAAVVAVIWATYRSLTS